MFVFRTIQRSVPQVRVPPEAVAKSRARVLLRGRGLHTGGRDRQQRVKQVQLLHLRLRPLSAVRPETGGRIEKLLFIQKILFPPPICRRTFLVPLRWLPTPSAPQQRSRGPLPPRRRQGRRQTLGPAPLLLGHPPWPAGPWVAVTRGSYPTAFTRRATKRLSKAPAAAKILPFKEIFNLRALPWKAVPTLGGCFLLYSMDTR